MKAHQAVYRVATMCRVLEVSTSGYYVWLKRPPSERDRTDAELLGRIQQFYERSDGTYGVPRIRKDLFEAGIRVGHKRVARLMLMAGLRGVCRRRRVITTQRSGSARRADDLADRTFAGDGLNQLWVADITYVPTWAGFLYLAVVMDVWSRKIVGLSMASHLRKELVLAALNMAIEQRRPHDVIHHSDQGTQYTSIQFGVRCRQAGVRPSMALLVTATTMPCVRASSPPSTARGSTDAPTGLTKRPGWTSSSSSKAGTTPISMEGFG